MRTTSAEASIDPRGSWTRFVLEGIVIVASILLAFGIDAWWERRQEARRETALLSALASDFRRSRPDLESRLSLARRTARNNALLTGILSESSGASSVSVPDSLILAVIGGPTYEPATDALDGALASGEIELIRNRELRDALATWRRTLLDTTEDELEVRRLTNEQIVPALAEDVPLAIYFERVVAWSDGEAPTGLPGHAALSPSSELVGLLALRQFYAAFSASDLEDLLGVLDEILALLEEGAA